VDPIHVSFARTKEGKGEGKGDDKGDRKGDRKGGKGKDLCGVLALSYHSTNVEQHFVITRLTYAHMTLVQLVHCLNLQQGQEPPKLQ
jgi:hypothetical protein